MGLLDEISKLTTPASELPDIEDDNDGSSALKLPKNRGKTMSNFDFEQGKYAGSAVSRKELFGDISEISGIHGKESDDSDDGEDEEDEEEEEEDDDVEVAEDSENGSENGEVGEDSGSDEDIDDEEDASEDESDAEDTEVPSKLKMTTLSIADDSDKADKATSVRHQRQVWDDLMYSNIRMHALLNSVNQMPRGEARKTLLKDSDEKTRESLGKVLENMAKLRMAMQKASDVFGGVKNDDDDEEIPSDDDEEIPSDSDENMDDEEEEDDDETEDVKNSADSERGTSLKTLAKNLERQDGALDKFRASTITKWYNRTKLLNAKSMNNTDFSVFEKGSILGQITKVLNDDEKLFKKVRTNRTGNRRLGTASAETIDNEIFDDSDFYQVLLKQMLESRSQNNSQDGADMTRSYMELQSMFGNKKKRDVSQLSSKDRRLKYEPIAKLINFYPSKPSVVTWSHESRNELFKSLFS